MDLHHPQILAVLAESQVEKGKVLWAALWQTETSKGESSVRDGPLVTRPDLESDCERWCLHG